jgi:HSP20 family protein
MAKRSSKENAPSVKQAKKQQPARTGAIKRAAAEKQPAPSRAGGPLAASGVPASPFALMRRFAEGMDRLFGDFRLDASPRLDFPFRGALAQGGAAWAPRVDVVEQGGKFVIRADLPGLTKNDVKVEVSDDAVAIRGERRQEKESKGKGFFHSERSYGSFYRAIPLPEGVDADQATATFRNGVLEVSMPAPTRSTKGRPVAIEE